MRSQLRCAALSLVAMCAVLASAHAQQLTAKYERKWIIPDIEGEEFTRMEVRRGATRQAMGDLSIKMFGLAGMTALRDGVQRDKSLRWPLMLGLVKVRANEDVVTEEGKRKVRVVAEASVEMEGLPDRAQRILVDAFWINAANKVEARWGELGDRRAALRERGEKEGAGPSAELKREYAALLNLQLANEAMERGLVLLMGRSEPNDPGQAKGYLQRALKFDPHLTLALQCRGLASIRTADWAEAIADFDEYLRIGSQGDSDAVNARGWAHLQLKNYARAKADFELATKLSSTNTRAWVNLGTAEHYLNQRGAAYAAWRKGCEAGAKETCDWLKKNPE